VCVSVAGAWLLRWVAKATRGGAADGAAEDTAAAADAAAPRKRRRMRRRRGAVVGGEQPPHSGAATPLSPARTQPKTQSSSGGGRGAAARGAEAEEEGDGEQGTAADDGDGGKGGGRRPPKWRRERARRLAAAAAAEGGGEAESAARGRKRSVEDTTRLPDETARASKQPRRRGESPLPMGPASTTQLREERAASNRLCTDPDCFRCRSLLLSPQARRATARSPLPSRRWRWRWRAGGRVAAAAAAAAVVVVVVVGAGCWGASQRSRPRRWSCRAAACSTASRSKPSQGCTSASFHPSSPFTQTHAEPTPNPRELRPCFGRVDEGGSIG
jgi:hypothetical protein